MKKYKILFIAGLSNKKLDQKLAPLLKIKQIEQIDLLRRMRYPSKAMIDWLKPNFLVNKSPFLTELWRIFKALTTGYRYDLIIGCHQFYHGFYAALAGKIWRKPVIQMIIGDVHRSMAKSFSAWSIRNSAACVVRGPISVGVLRDQYKYLKPIEIIHNIGTPFALVNNDVPKKYDIITVANNARAKDFPWLFKIISELKKKTPQIKVLICGKNVQKNYQTLVERLNISNVLTFAGECNQSELEHYYKASKMFLLTSKTEGLPMVLIEALTYGVPIATTAVGEIPWLIRDGIDGYLFEHGNTKQAILTIEKMLASDIITIGPAECYKRLSELEDNFSEKSNISIWENLIEKIN